MPWGATNWRGSIPALVFVVTLTSHPAGFAQGRRGAISRTPRAVPEQASRTPIDEFETMSPEEQQKALDRLPPEERQKVRQQLQRFKALPPEQQQALRNLYTRLHQLPPERKETVRRAVVRFSEQPPDRRQAIRNEFLNLANLLEPQRQTRMASAEFRATFNRKEQGIIRDMAPLLPVR
jgi:hypothetical protein